MEHATEYALREQALDDYNISYILTQKCNKSRNVVYKCNGNCSNIFSSIIEAFETIKKFRQTIWIDPETLDFNFKTNNDGGLDIRKSAFIKETLSMTSTNESGDIVLNYKIGGMRVCKYFYFRATGFSKKIFNRGISFIVSRLNHSNSENVMSDYDTLSTKPIFAHICGHNANFPQKIFKPTELEVNDPQLNVISFLDLFFKAHCDVDHAPEESDVKYVRLTWNGVYDEYLKHCNLIPIKAVPYNQFTSIR